MDEQKRNRIAAAITVNVILLIVILVSVVIYTLVEVAVKSKYKRELEAEIANYKRLIEENEDYLELLQSDEHLLYLALINGYVFQPETTD